MRLSVQKLRWLLVVGAVLLVALLMGFLGYGRWKALKRLTDLRNKVEKELRDTQNVTYSQTVGGRTIFTVQAASGTRLGDGKFVLHKAKLLLYGRVQGSVDAIYGDEFQYDQKSGLTRAIGEVQIDLQAPHSLAATGRAAPAAGGAAAPDGGHQGVDVIHVRTSGLTYIPKLHVAATEERVEMHYGSIECTSRGAEFNSEMSTLHLLADVHMTGQVHGAPMTMTAAMADMDRTANVAQFTQPVVQSAGRTARAEHITANLRKDGSIESASATGRVLLSSGTQQVSAGRLDTKHGPSSLPESARFSGGVTMVDVDAARPAQGSASTVDALFDAHGQPVKFIAKGGARGAMVDHRAGGDKGLRREIGGEQIIALLAPAVAKAGTHRAGALLSDLRVIGAARAVGDSLVSASKGASPAASALKSTQITADDLHAVLGEGVDGRTEIQRLTGAGHTMLQQDGPQGAQQVSKGDALEMIFGAGARGAAGDIVSATQTGGVSIRSRAAAKGSAKTAQAVTTATAARAVYEGATEKLVLSGGAHVSDGSTTLAAGSVTLDQRSGDAFAQGNVLATLQGTLGAANSASARSEPITHVMAESGRLQHEAGLADFHGTDAQPARLWQGASQVEAANLFFDNGKRTLSARPASADALVHAVFASDAPTKKPQRNGSAVNLIRVASERMDYNDAQRDAVFAGNVAVDGTAGELHAQRAVVMLHAAAKPVAKAAENTVANPFSGSIDKVVMTGNVRLEEPGRSGTGEQLVYNATSDNYVLTGTAGKPPKIVDAKQGSVTGSTLVFSEAGSNIVVAGEPGSAKSGDVTKARVRVRTETDVKK